MQIDVKQGKTTLCSGARPNLERSWIVHEPTISLLVFRRVSSSLQVYTL
jgi:hypothetical protein